VTEPATISLSGLAFSFIPVAIVVYFLYIWALKPGHSTYAAARMLLQLLVIGYFLEFIFASNLLAVLLLLSAMVLISSWIALGVVPDKRQELYLKALLAIGVAGGFVLALMLKGVMQLDDWYRPRIIIPIAGMIFANTMNAISLAADNFYADDMHVKDYTEARNRAMRTALIPITNSLFAVGLVAISGMMTGQILSGVSPLIAARYQIMVMCMLFGASGIGTIMFLWLIKENK